MEKYGVRWQARQAKRDTALDGAAACDLRRKSGVALRLPPHSTVL